jgi:hypothetical protein
MYWVPWCTAENRTFKRISEGVQRQLTCRTQYDVYCITHKAPKITFMSMLPTASRRIIYIFYETYFLRQQFIHALFITGVEMAVNDKYKYDPTEI